MGSKVGDRIFIGFYLCSILMAIIGSIATNGSTAENNLGEVVLAIGLRGL